MSLLPGVLDGIKVVEFAQNAAVPHCGRLLAGLGADVVKIEPPEGDAMRYLAPAGPGEGRAYLAINPGKRSMAIDLTKPDAQDVVDQLLAWADIALVAFKLPDLARYGLDWEHAQTVNPRLIYLSGTALGPEGDASDEPGYDVLVQGRGGIGFMMNRGGPEPESATNAPMPTRPAINDFGTGFVSAFAVMAALRHRDQTGEGQRVDTSLLGTSVSLGTPLIASFPGDENRTAEIDEELGVMRMAGVGFDEQRAHYDRRVTPAGGAFRLYFRHYVTGDGVMSIAGLSPGLIAKFHEVTGVPVPQVRDPQHEEFQAIVAQAEQLFASKTTAEMTELLQSVGYPCGPYNLPHEALVDDQVVANDYVVELEHPTIGTYRASGMPLRMEKSRSEIRSASPPFAVHSREVLAEIGTDADVVERWLSGGTVIDGNDD